jgi:hypothetical protein
MCHKNRCTSPESIPGLQTCRRSLQWMGYLGSRWIINVCASPYRRVANVRVAKLLERKIKIWCLCLAKLFVHCNFQLPLFIRFVVLSFYIIAISYGVPSALYWNTQTCCNSKARMPELTAPSFLQIIYIYALRLKLTVLCKMQSKRRPTALATRWPKNLAFLYNTYNGTCMNRTPCFLRKCLRSRENILQINVRKEIVKRVLLEELIVA